jgi:hypothetical protein
MASSQVVTDNDTPLIAFWHVGAKQCFVTPSWSAAPYEVRICMGDIVENAAFFASHSEALDFAAEQMDLAELFDRR